MKLINALRHAEQKLADANIDTHALDARLLVEHVLRLDRVVLLSQPERELNAEEIQKIESVITRRAAHEPVARIIGEREFWSLPFGLNEATLEPRPDSETLVEVALKHLRRKTAPYILDLGTGTGCLLLSILHELPTATGVGIDVAPRAIEQAQRNTERLGLSSQVNFKLGNWLDGITETFDAIVSNPPYIPSGDISALMPEVRDHDPMRALDGGDDGLAAYRHLIPQLQQFLKPEGFVIFEVGINQAEAVAGLCHTSGLIDVSVHKDLGGIDRCVTARRQDAIA